MYYQIREGRRAGRIVRRLATPASALQRHVYVSLSAQRPGQDPCDGPEDTRRRFPQPSGHPG